VVSKNDWLVLSSHVVVWRSVLIVWIVFWLLLVRIDDLRVFLADWTVGLRRILRAGGHYMNRFKQRFILQRVCWAQRPILKFIFLSFCYWAHLLWRQQQQSLLWLNKLRCRLFTTILCKGSLTRRHLIFKWSLYRRPHNGGCIGARAEKLYVLILDKL